MFVVGNLIGAIAQILAIVLELYMWVVIIAALISWVNPDPYNPVVRFLRSATEPVFKRIRSYLPATGGIDFTPILVILAIIFLQKFLVATLIEMAQNMR